MGWLPMEYAPRDGTPVAYLWHEGVLSTCAWIAEADEPGWWDLRAEEPASPTCWMPIEPPTAPVDDRTLAVLSA